ncbi:unnamed protein product [Phytophthora fragariaefolia]|uniref:Unnamed protein product n=1 Tax=Phytophthora fragariaefolia TaxID=1490495 RepID=A0A9W6Y350_9STRA|nr:unnamed protein product [Phytophthora fragariaefolia]
MFKPRKAPPLPPKLTFQPTISKKSKWLLKKKQRELMANAENDTLDGTQQRQDMTDFGPFYNPNNSSIRGGQS